MNVPGLDCASVVEFARDRPLEFLGAVVGVITNEGASKEQVCAAIVVSRSVFTVEALGISPEPSDLFGRYCEIVKWLMESEDEDVRFHAAVSFAVFSEYFLTVEMKTTLLADICQGVVGRKGAYLVALSVLVREMDVGPTGSQMAIRAVLATLVESADIQASLDVIENTIGYLARNFDCSEIWRPLMALIDTPEYIEACLSAFTASRKWQLRTCGPEALAHLVSKALAHGLANPSSQVRVCEFLLRMSRSFPELFTYDVLVRTVQVAMNVIASDDMDLTEQGNGSWGIALLQSMVPIDDKAIQNALTSVITDPYLAAVIVYLLVDSGVLSDMQVIGRVVGLALQSRPRVVVIGLELIQLLLEKGAALPYADIMETCKRLLLVDYASSAASVALFAVVQQVDVNTDAFCHELLTLSGHAPSPYTASSIIDLVTLCLPDLGDVPAFCRDVLRLVEQRMNAIKETEVMSSFCYLLVEAMKWAALADDILMTVFNLYMALQETSENFDAALKCIGRMAVIVAPKLALVVVPTMEHVLKRAADFQDKQSFDAAVFAWKMFIRASMDIASFVLPMQEILLRATNSDTLENRASAFNTIAMNMAFFPSLLLPTLPAVEQACIHGTRANLPDLMVPVMRCFNALMTYPNHILSPEAIHALQFVLDDLSDSDCPDVNECKQRLATQISRHTITFTHCTAAV